MSENETSRSALHCSGREEAIAALVDGGLSNGEQEELRLHIASCEVCYELLTELMHLTDSEVSESDSDESESTEPLPFAAPAPAPSPVPERRFGLRSVGGLIAAAVLLVLAVPFLRSPDPMAGRLLVADLSLPDSSLADLAQPGWEDPDRSIGQEDIAANTRSFRAGVLWVGLNLAVAQERGDVGQKLCSDLLDLARREKAEPVIRGLEGVYDALENPSRESAELLAEVDKLESELTGSGGVDPTYFSLGKLVEASRLAAEHGVVDFFTHPERREAWVSMIDSLGSAAEPSLVQALELWKKRPLLESDLERAGELYLQALEVYGEVPDEPALPLSASADDPPISGGGGSDADESGDDG